MSFAERKLFRLSPDVVDLGLRSEAVEVGLRRVGRSDDANGRLLLRLEHFFRFLFGKVGRSLSNVVDVGGRKGANCDRRLPLEKLLRPDDRLFDLSDERVLSGSLSCWWGWRGWGEGLPSCLGPRSGRGRGRREP